MPTGYFYAQKWQKIRSSRSVFRDNMLQKTNVGGEKMRYIDDLLCLFGILCIVCAAFGVDWRLGMLTLGVGAIASGIVVGRFLAQTPNMHVKKTNMHVKKKRTKEDRGDEA